jgi:hypothetical protein
VTPQLHRTKGKGHAGAYSQPTKGERPGFRNPEVIRPMQETTGVGRYPDRKTGKRRPDKPLTERQVAAYQRVTKHWQTTTTIGVLAGLTPAQAGAALRELHLAGRIMQRKTGPQLCARSEWKVPR